MLSPLSAALVHPLFSEILLIWTPAQAFPSLKVSIDPHQVPRHYLCVPLRNIFSFVHVTLKISHLFLRYQTQALQR